MLLSRDPLVKAGCTSTTHRLVLGPAGSSCAWLGYGWSPAEGTPDRDTKTCGKRGEVRRNSKSSWRLIYSIKNQHLRSLAWEEHNPSTLGMEEGFTFRQGKYYKWSHGCHHTKWERQKRATPENTLSLGLPPIRQVQASGITGWLWIVTPSFCQVNATSCPEEKGPFAFSWPVGRSLDSSSVSRAGPLLLSSNKFLLEADCFYHFWEQDTKPIFAPVKLQSSFPQPLVWRVDIDIMHTHGHIQGTLSSATLCNGLITVFSCFICRFFILYMLLQSYFDRTNNNPLQLNLCIAKIINFAFPGMTTAIVNFKGVLDC